MCPGWLWEAKPGTNGVGDPERAGHTFWLDRRAAVTLRSRRIA